jgi:hypothetical protein
MRFPPDRYAPAARNGEMLRSEGHDAIHARDIGLADLTDREVLARATEDGRIVLTFDLDFGEILGQTGAAGSGGCAVAPAIGSPALFARPAAERDCRSALRIASRCNCGGGGFSHPHQTDATGDKPTGAAGTETSV